MDWTLTACRWLFLCLAQANPLQSGGGESRTSVESISIQRQPDTKNRNPQGGIFSATECPIRASNQSTPAPTTRLLSMAPSNKKKKRRIFKGASVAELSKAFQGDGTPNSGTAVASAKAVQSVLPKAAKGIHAGIGSQGNVHAAGPSTSNAVYPGSSSLNSFSRIPYSSSPAARLLSSSFVSPNSSSSSLFSSDTSRILSQCVVPHQCTMYIVFSSLYLCSTIRPQYSTFRTDQRLLANNRYGVLSPRRIFSYPAWIARLAFRKLRAWVSYLVYKVLLARKLLLIALILGLFASVAVSIQCTNQYPQLSLQLEKYIHTNRNSSAQLDASASRYQDLEEQTLGLSKKIESMRDISQVKKRIQTNWLSPLVGAAIIPELCSHPSRPKKLKFDYSNHEKPENLTKQETYKSQFQNNPGPSVPGPETALLPWKEAERRYCVGEGQVLQLGVSSPRKILPTSLIIEHWRMGEVPGSLMRRAPKDIELWTYIRAEDDAAKVRDEALTNYPGLTNSSQQNESLILNFPWIPIGVFRFEIDTANNVQEFRIDYDLKIPMEHFAIRVISNWGHVGETCLVRVRLYGEEVVRKEVGRTKDHVKRKGRFWWRESPDSSSPE